MSQRDQLCRVKRNSISVRRYDTPELLNEAFWTPVAKDQGISYEEMMSTTTLGGTTVDGEDLDLSAEDAIQSMRDQGLWGFADNAHTIHFWGNEASLEVLTCFFAHEMHHLCKDQLEDAFKVKDEELSEECVADYVAFVARDALILAQQFIKDAKLMRYELK